MSKVQHWVVLNPDDSVNCQPKIMGTAAPSATGDNPGGLREFKVSRPGDITHERYNVASRRWVSDASRKGLAERQARREAMTRDELAEHIAEEVEARLYGHIAAIEARLQALEER